MPFRTGLAGVVAGASHNFLKIETFGLTPKNPKVMYSTSNVHYIEGINRWDYLPPLPSPLVPLKTGVVGLTRGHDDRFQKA